MVDLQLAVGVGIWLALSALGVFVVYRSRPAEVDDEWRTSIDSLDD